MPMNSGPNNIQNSSMNIMPNRSNVYPMQTPSPGHPTNFSNQVNNLEYKTPPNYNQPNYSRSMTDLEGNTFISFIP